MKKSIKFSALKGMQKDMSKAMFNSDFAYDLKNVRISQINDETFGSIVTDKGNKRLITTNLRPIIDGIPIGKAEFNDSIIIFSVGEDDEGNTFNKITKFTTAINGMLKKEVLYTGNLNFNTKYPIETLVYYENEELQKVYWTDGLNSPRIINVAAGSTDRETWNDNTFNFIRKLKLNEEVTIQRLNTGGVFSPGTIQYVCTYFNLYGQESNIFYQSPLYYTSYVDRGADAESKVSNSFSIKIANVDTSFEYVRIYSIHRSSNNATPEVKKVVDIKINRDATYGIVTTTNLTVPLSVKPVQKVIVRPGDDWEWLNGSNTPPVDLTSIIGTRDVNEPLDIFDLLDKTGGGSGGGTTDGNGTITTGGQGGGSRPYIIGDTIITNSGNGTITTDGDNATIEADYITYIEDGYSINYIDNGTQGEIIDPTSLLYVGGEDIVFSTFTQKDNTMFVGNIKLNVHMISDDIRKALNNNTITFKYNEIPEPIETIKAIRNSSSIDPIIPYSRTLPTPEPEGFYPYENQLKYNSNKIKIFKYLETYRFGVQFQHNTGKWSEVIWINDVKNTLPIKSAFYNGSDFSIPYAYFYFNNKELITKLVNDGFIKARPVVVLPTEEERECICQGVLCPTVYNAKDRADGSIFAQSSWFFRPNIPFDIFHNADDNTELGKVGIDDTQGYPEYSRGGIINNDNYSKPIFTEQQSQSQFSEFRHNYPIPSNIYRNSEIQCLYNVANNPYLNNKGQSEWLTEYGSNYFIDNSIITLHSPDIEFNDNITYQINDAKLRIIGIIPITSFDSKLDIQTSTAVRQVRGLNSSMYSPSGFSTNRNKVINIDNNFTYKSGNIINYGNSYYGYRMRLSNPLWMDGFGIEMIDNDSGNLAITADLDRNYGFCVYPWHRSGSLNNESNEYNTGTRSSILKTKSLLNYRYSYKPSYFTNDNIWNAEVKNNHYRNGISDAVLWNSNEDNIVKLKAPSNSGLNDIVYKGNINKLLTTTTPEYGINTVTFNYKETPGNPVNLDITSNVEKITNRYPIVISTLVKQTATPDSDIDINVANGSMEKIDTFVSRGRFFDKWHEIKDKQYILSNYLKKELKISKEDVTSNDPVSIKYKSTPHIILSLNYSDYNDNIILPTLYDGPSPSSNKYGLNNLTFSYSVMPFWKNTSNYHVYQESLDIPNLDRQLTNIQSPQYGWLWIGELYRDTILNKFGGQTEEAFENNMWLPSGETISLIDENEEDGIAKSFTLRWLEGDTYFQRYDCMKTYPYTLEDTNQVTEILSFMCETRVNIDGRYDRNRGSAIQGLTPTNFNLLNTAYTQDNNFFVYRGLNTNRINLDRFTNQVAWTKTKTAGELIDTWTNINLANTLDLDGNNGELVKLENINGSIIAFQDTGISNILYNEKEQIPITNGVPIEISNSNKVTGKRYLSDTIGCQNKWSICKTPSGIYFIDDKNNSINMIGGEGIISLSDKLGFHSWINNNSTLKVWNPVDFDNFITYYDKTNNDVLFIGKDTCLAYSETLGQFSSFYSYDNTPYILNLENKTIMLHKDNSNTSDNNYYLWEHNKGNYNEYFGKREPFSITVIANDKQSQGDNIFDTIDLQADTLYNSSVLPDTLDIKDLTVWNEYQEGTSYLTFKHGIPTNLKKKFRIWRANIPRNTKGLTIGTKGRDRMRNPWLAIELSGSSYNNRETIIHSINVNYFSN